MNKERRKELQAIIEGIEDLLTKLDEVKGEEEEAFENLPENFQESERGEAMQEAIDMMDGAYSSLEDAIESLQEVAG